MSIARKFSHFSKKEVQHLFKKGKCLLNKSGLLLLQAPAAKTAGRILIVTPAKIGNAPVRNRIRRRLKEIFYTHRLYERPYDVAVVIRKDAVELTFKELTSLITGALK